MTNRIIDVLLTIPFSALLLKVVLYFLIYLLQTMSSDEDGQLLNEVRVEKTKTDVVPDEVSQNEKIISKDKKLVSLSMTAD